MDELNITFEKIDLTASHTKLEISQNRNDVFVYGSVRLAMLGKENVEWNPGSFYGGNHLSEVNSQFYQDNLLNYQTEVKEFSEKLEWKDQEQKFIKPYKFAKLFTGNIFTKIKWENFVENSLQDPNNTLLKENSLVQISIPRDIIKEARLWIVGEKVVEAVYYNIIKDIPYEEHVEKEGIEFAERIVSIFNVAAAFVMDICLTDIGWKIVEINCINSAGFFPNVDVKKIFKALSDHFTK